MRILVTGATGRIGLPLIRALRTAGHEVRVLVAPDDPGAGRVATETTDVIVGDIASEEACASAVDGVAAIYHLAGRLPQDAADADLLRVNVAGTWRLMDAASRRATDLAVVVFASTNDVYSAQEPVYNPIDEAHPRRPVSTYGLTKVLGEEVARYHLLRSDLPVAIARFGLTQAARELIDGLTAPNFLLSARVAALRGTDDPGNRTDHRSPGGDEPSGGVEPAGGGSTRHGASRRHPTSLGEMEAILRERGEHAIALRDESGRPWRYHICDVEDLVSGLVRFLDHPAAIGEAINLTSPAPFGTDEAARYLAARAGLPVLDVIAPGPGLRFTESITKARSILGYDPQRTIERMLDAGLETTRGTFPPG